jgi:hypothetical protein
VPGLPSVFRHLLKEAAAAHLTEGWALRGAGLVLHAPDGCWGQIVFSGASRERSEPLLENYNGYDDSAVAFPILEMSLTAGTCAPYLMRVVNRLDPSKPPPPNFVAAHTRVCWYAPLRFARSVRVTPSPFEIPTGVWTDDRYCIEAETATPWLAAALAKLAPATRALTSNRAIYDRLGAEENFFSLRYAYLLARHLGLDGDLGPLEERARNAEARARKAAVSRAASADRQTRYPQDWSHERFMRFVEATPR